MNLIRREEIILLDVRGNELDIGDRVLTATHGELHEGHVESISENRVTLSIITVNALEEIVEEYSIHRFSKEVVKI